MNHYFTSFRIRLIFIVLSLIGGFTILKQELVLLPTKHVPEIVIQYHWNEQLPINIEKKVTVLIENTCSNLPHLKDIHSVSSYGYGEVKLSFEDDADLQHTRLLVSNYISQLKPYFPKEISYPTAKINDSNKNSKILLNYSIASNQNQHEIKKQVDGHLLNEINRIKGIEETKVFGTTTPEVQLYINPKLCNKYSITKNELENALRVHLSDFDEGMEVLSNQEIFQKIQWKAKAYPFGTLANIPIKNFNSKVIYLKDIATIKKGFQKPTSFFRTNGLNNISMVIYAKSNANSINLAREVNQIIAKKKTNFPDDYHIEKTYDASDFLKKEIKKIIYRTALSLLILMVILGLVYRSSELMILMLCFVGANSFIALLFFYILNIQLHLYSLAGFTVSLGIILDNAIVSSEVYKKTGSKNIFKSITSATLTTISASLIVFLFNAGNQNNLIDFVMVIIITLLISIPLAYFLIPASIPFVSPKPQKTLFEERKDLYIRTLLYLKKYRIIFFILFIFSFGTPYFLLPNTLTSEQFPTAVRKLYNSSIGHSDYQKNWHKKVSSVLGGTLYLFSEKVFSNATVDTPDETKITIQAQLPKGTSIEKMNRNFKLLENYISTFGSVGRFITEINAIDDAKITLYFKEDEKNNLFFIQKKLENKVAEIGGVLWNIQGTGKGFGGGTISNKQSNTFIIFRGYNWKTLTEISTEFKESILSHPRVTQAYLKSNTNWGEYPEEEIVLNLDQKKLSKYKVLKKDVLNLIEASFNEYTLLKPVNFYEQRYSLKIYPYHHFPLFWDAMNHTLSLDQSFPIQLAGISKLEKVSKNIDIIKNNQSYQLILAFEFVGSKNIKTKFLKKEMAQLKSKLPVGYTVEIHDPFKGWNKSNTQQYYMLLVVCLLIFMICSIQFESISQPLIVISVIPVTFIGIFLAFYVFNANFDQGGYASFLFVMGLSVNGSIYLISAYNQKRKHINDNAIAYAMAFNENIKPILITVLSTIVSLLPFILVESRDIFWFAFAIGSIGGLLFSLLGQLALIPFLLPIKKTTV